MLRLPDGALLVINDRGPEVYRVKFLAGKPEADLELETGCFPQGPTTTALRSKPRRFDAEGLAHDPDGRFYLCDESDRWVMRWDPASRRVERLAIDWSPVTRYFSADRNACWEGIAFGAGRLYLANERDAGRIVVVDPDRLTVVDEFEVRTPTGRFWDDHYSDLSWFDGALYVLLREARSILRVDPATHRVVAAYDYQSVEDAPAHAYVRLLPLVGVMEGLAVETNAFWLVTDNNDQPRVAARADRRPTLFRCVPAD